MSAQTSADLGGSTFERQLRRTFSSLRNRNFKLFFIGQSISNTGNWLTNVALLLLTYQLTRSGLAVGLMSACMTGPILFLSAWAGAIADRSDKRHMLLWTQSLEMCESIGLAILAFLPHTPIAALYALAVFGGVLLAFDNPLRRSFVSEMVPPEDIPNAVVLYSLIVNVARMIGPAVAGVLIATVGYGWGFSIDAATYTVVLLCIVMMRPAELHRLPPRPRAKGEIREGLRYVMSMPVLWISFAMLIAIGMLSYNFNVTLQLFVTLGLHANGVLYSFLLAVYAFGAVVSALVVANRALVRMRHIITGAVALGVTMLLMAAAPTFAFALPAAFLIGAASILYLTASTAILQVEGKKEMHGRIIALQTVVIGGGGLIGGPLLGWLADVAGGRVPIILGGVVCLAAAAFGLWANRRFAHESTPHDDVVPAPPL